MKHRDSVDHVDRLFPYLYCLLYRLCDLLLMTIGILELFRAHSQTFVGDGIIYGIEMAAKTLLLALL